MLRIDPRASALGAIVAAVCLAARAALCQAPATPESLCTIPAAAAQEKVRKDFGDGFAVVETKHFRLISDSAPRYRKLIAGGLEQFYGLVHDRFFKKEMKPVAVYLIDGAEDYDAFCQKRGHGDLGGGGYGVYVPAERAIYTRRLMPDGTMSGFGTLFHESIHAMVHADFGFNPPAWFDEGFASLFEQGRIVKGAWVYGNPNPWRDGPYQEAFEAGRIQPLAKYLALSDKDFRLQDELLNYNTGRSLCVWLLLQGEDKLAKYVDLVRQKKSGAAAVEGATGKKLADVEKAWREHVKSVHFAGACIQRARKAGDGAEKILAEGVQKFPRSGVLHLEYAQRLAGAGKAEDAAREALLALEDPRLPMPADAWRVLLFRYSSGDDPKALEAAKMIVEMQPWLEILNDKAFTKLASLLQAQGKPEEAQKVESELERLRQEDRRGE